MTKRQIAESHLHSLLNATDEVSRLSQIAAVSFALGNTVRALEVLEQARRPADIAESWVRASIRAIREAALDEAEKELSP